MVGDPGSGVVATAVGNEAGGGEAGRFDLQRAIHGNFRGTRGRHRRAVDGFTVLRSVDGMGSGKVPQLWDRECAAGAVHNSGGVAARDGEWGHAGAFIAAAAPGIVRVGAVNSGG